jgi:hypothetical protein
MKNNLIFLGCIFILLASACTSRTDKIKLNQARGNEIVQALNEYKQTSGQFPETLNALTPSYLSKIPKTVEGDDFEYELLTGGRPFFLGFYVDGKPACIWDCTQGIDH